MQEELTIHVSPKVREELSKGDVLNVICSPGAGADFKAKVTNITADTINWRRLTWCEQLWLKWCQVWFETFPYFSSHFVPV